ncbi:hypothetical protein BJ165DRAFT_1420606 [Panaeolus papilionaceus]|nr:hypothetical protein BJ165DRAFT_1420606 [Panaeolus papilionaceus]
MSINTPTALVESFKKSGEFERLRRDLLAQFQQDEAYTGLKSKIDEIVRQRFADSPMLLYLPPENAFDEVGKEVARNKLLGAATLEAKFLSDPSFLSALQASIQKVLDEEKQLPKEPAVKEPTTDDTTRTFVSQDIQDTLVVTPDPALQNSAQTDNSASLVERPSTVIAVHQADEAPSPVDAHPNVATPRHTQTNKSSKEPETIPTDMKSDPSSPNTNLPEPNIEVQVQDASAHDIVMADA